MSLNSQMQKIKEIILSRIQDILTLQKAGNFNTELQSSSRYSVILKQKQTECLRNIQETELLANLQQNSSKFNQNEGMRDIWDICSAYDPDILNYCELHKSEGAVSFLENFFMRNGFAQKIPDLLAISKENAGQIPAKNIYNWLSQWSKKTYCRIIQSVIPKSSNNPQIQTELQQTHFEEARHENKAIASNFFSRSIESSNKLKAEETGNTKLLIIYNRITLYSYIVDELKQYYRLTGVPELDRTFLKGLVKKPLKQRLMKPNNLSKAVDILLESPVNKELSRQIKQYEDEYKAFFEEKKRLAERKRNKCDDKADITRRNFQCNLYAHSNISMNMKPLSKRNKTMTDSGVTVQARNIKFELDNYEGPCLLISEKCKIINELSLKRSNPQKKFDRNYNSPNFRLPSICEPLYQKLYSSQKGQIMDIPLRVSTEPNEGTENADSFRNRYGKKQKAIKSIIVRNFLSIREKNKRKEEKNEDAAKFEKQLLINNFSIKVAAEQKRIIESMPSSVDLKSIRQRTRAILKNLKSIQHYQ